MHGKEREPKNYTVQEKKSLATMARERAMTYGISNASIEELLAIILGGSVPDETMNQLLTEGIVKISTLTVEELTKLQGITKQKAVKLIAAFGLAFKLASTSPVNRPIIKCPKDAATLVMEEMRHLDREHFCALLLNTKHQVLAKETVSIGTLNSSMVHPRELFKFAVKRSAAALILVHNHPSGDPTPSREDREITMRLREAGAIIGIEVLDHIIIGDNKFASFKEMALLT